MKLDLRQRRKERIARREADANTAEEQTEAKAQDEEVVEEEEVEEEEAKTKGKAQDEEEKPEEKPEEEEAEGKKSKSKAQDEEPVEEEEVVEEEEAKTKGKAQDEEEKPEEEDSEAMLPGVHHGKKKSKGDSEAGAEFSQQILADIYKLDGEGVIQSDVNMTLFNEDGDNPFWNIDISGQPIAQVSLKDQPRTEEIRSSFVSEQYALGVSQAIEKVGLKEVLKSVNAKLWSNEIQNAEVVKQAHEAAKATFEDAYKQKAAELTDRVFECMAIVAAGMDKNFYPEVGNPLKEALWMKIRECGIADPLPTIEAAFNQGATDWFKAILDKSMAYLNMNPEALAEIKKAISSADTIKPEEVEAAQGETLAQHLADNQVHAFALPQPGPADEKNKLKGELRLSKKGL
jgi:hypothetical protein